MKKLLSILCTGLLLCGAGLTSCENYDDPVTGNAYGNNSIPEGRTISIAALKEKYNDFIDTSKDTYTIDCKGLQIGSYRKQAQIGTVYNNSVGRMPEYVWKQHVRLINEPKLYYPELTPIEITTPADLAAIDLKEAPVLVTFKNVKLTEADGSATYAPGDEGSVKRYFTYADGTQSGSNLFLYTSAYANFSMEVMPQGSVNITGILLRYNNQWEVVVRTLSDIKRNN